MPFFETTKNNYLISTDPGRLDIELIHDFLSTRSYWARGEDRETVERSIRNSLCFGLYALELESIVQKSVGQPLSGVFAPKSVVQVGFARVITDYASSARLVDVFILEEYRGQGLGKWLVETVLAYPELQTVRRWMLSTQDAHELYAQFGFHPLEHPEMQMEKVVSSAEPE